MGKQDKLLVPSPAAPVTPHGEKGRGLRVEDQRRTRSLGEMEQRTLDWRMGRGQPGWAWVVLGVGGHGWGPTPASEEALSGLKRDSRQQAILGMCWTLQSWPLRPEP